MKILVQDLTLKPRLMTVEEVVDNYYLDENDINSLKNGKQVWSNDVYFNLYDKNH